MSCPSFTPGIVFIAVLFITCSRPVPYETTSSTVSDTTEILNHTAALTPVEPEPLATAEEASYVNQIEKMRRVLENRTDFYEVSVSAMQYEARSDVTWYFDKSFSPLYFKDDWAMEGTEGSTEYFIMENEIHCAIDEESYGTGTSTTKWCRTTGGTKTTYDDDQGREQTEALPENYEREVTTAYNDKLSTLTQILKAATLESDDTEIYRLKIEDKPYESDDFVETTSIIIPKSLYDELMK
jgi:hypothetical protein